MKNFIKCVIICAGIFLIVEKSNAQQDHSNTQLVTKIIDKNQEIHWLLKQKPELIDKLNQFLIKLPPDLNYDLVLKKVTELILRYSNSKDYSLLFERLYQEIVLHQSRYTIRKKAKVTKRNLTNPKDQINNTSVIVEDFQVNENVGSCDQELPTVAVASDGSFVAAWIDYRNVDADIFMRRFDSSGSGLGESIQVNNDQTNAAQTIPAIAIDGNGNFVIVWQDSRNGNADIYAQRFDSNGSPLSDNFKVNNDMGTSNQQEPAITMMTNGRFIISWWDRRNDNGDIYAQMFNGNGGAIGANFLVNDDAFTGIQQSPDLDTDVNGNFVICWHDIVDNDGIYARKFNQNGQPGGSTFQIGSGESPAIAFDFSGNLAISWTKGGDLYARTYDSGGAPITSEFLINDSEEPEYSVDPDLIVDSSGDFAIVWNEREWYRPNDYGAWITMNRFNINGQLLFGNQSVGTGRWPISPVIGSDANRNLIIAWQDDRNGYSDHDIYAQRYDHNNQPINGNFRLNDDRGSSSQTYPSLGVYQGGNFLIAWEDLRVGYDGIYTQRFAATGQPIGNNFEVFSLYSNTFLEENATAVFTNGVFVTGWTKTWWKGIFPLRSITGDLFDVNNLLIESLDIAYGDPAYGVAWVGDPAVAFDGNGNFVFTWIEEDYDYTFLYAGRYNELGESLGGVVVSNSDFLIKDPDIATTVSGDYVITWNKRYDIYMRYYNSNGSSVTGQVKVNDDIGGSENYKLGPAIAADNAGKFIIVWLDYRNGNADIYSQYYNANIQSVGTNFLVNNDNTFSDQYSPSVTTNENSEYVITWEDYRNGDADIYAQKYSSNRTTIGGNYRVNNDIGSASQVTPRVDMLNNRIYFTWQDNRVPGQGWDIFARVEEFLPSEVGSFAVNLSGPTQLDVINNQYSPNPFIATAVVEYSSNTTIDALNVEGKISLGPGLRLASSEVPSFYDDFSDGNADAWHPNTPSKWSVTSLNGNYAYCLSIPNEGGNEYSLLPTNWTDFELELDAQAQSNTNYFVIFAVQDLNNSTDNGYYVRFTSFYGVDLFRTISDEGEVLASSSYNSMVDGSFHRIRIVRQYPNIKIYVDQQPVIDSNDATFALGYIGIGSWKNTACFDNIQITALSSAEEQTKTVGTLTPGSWKQLVWFVFADGTYTGNSWYAVNVSSSNVDAVQRSRTIYLPELSQLYTISGMVNYYEGNRPVSGVQTSLSPTGQIVVSASNGNYSFTDLEGGIDYIVTPAKASGSHQSSTTVTSQDAYEAGQIAFGIISPNSYQILAADVDEDGQILMWDASLIARYSAGMQLPAEAKVGDWRFDPGQRNYPALDSDQPGQNYTAVVIGDVDGSWTVNSNLLLAQPIFENTLKTLVIDSNRIHIPVSFEKDIEVTSLDLQVQYNTKELNYIGFNGSALNQDFHTFENPSSGLIRIAGFALRPKRIESAHSVFELVFEKTSGFNGQSEIVFARFLINGKQQGTYTVSIASSPQYAELPEEFHLYQNYPNPFNTSTIIRYDLPWLDSKQTSLQIYDITGRLLRTIIQSAQTSGTYHINWDGMDDRGVEVSTGVYFLVLKSGRMKSFKKVIKAK